MEPKHDHGLGTPPSMAVLLVANLPFAMCFSVLEVVLPALLVTRMQASAFWPAALFVANTVLVILFQVSVVKWLSKRARGTVFAASGVVLGLSYLGFWAGEAMGAVAIAVVGVVYTLGEILYTGSGTALVIAATPPARLGALPAFPPDLVWHAPRPRSWRCSRLTRPCCGDASR